MRQIDPDVVCAYPITPQTEIVQLYAQMVADGKVTSEFVTVESEHSAMSAVIGSAAAGARTMTATSSQGFALMWELLFVASSYRLPVVMTTVNRALSGPINIHCDHSDTMGGRDTGWIQIYGENHQQAYDNCIQAIRIAEHMDVRTPAMHMYDGYVISGAIGPLVMLPDETVQEFIGPFHAVNPLLNPKRPVAVGPFDGLHGWYFEHKVSQNRAMDRALAVIQSVADEYAELSGRHYGLIEPYRLDDAEIAIVVVGSTAGTTRMIVDKLRAKGVKAGMLRVRVLRPFPHAAYAKALEHVKVVGVMDRADSFGAQGGPVFLEVRAALYDSDPRPQVLPFIYGLGGRDIYPDNIEQAFAVLEQAAQSKVRTSTERRYLNLRED
ncbi:MAG: pyruvate ferredoxin oxidoreductase [Actinobacteria bacterium RBG_16_64_13]|nr:MAG: pyruvate ferredoxin oxidoreductase [Actinobacteria bacterium RBG_16_64_13]